MSTGFQVPLVFASDVSVIVSSMRVCTYVLPQVPESVYKKIRRNLHLKKADRVRKCFVVRFVCCVISNVLPSPLSLAVSSKFSTCWGCFLHFPVVAHV